MKTGAVILAAGRSSRMGGFKPMLKIGSITVIRRVIQTMRQAGADPVVLVTGRQAELLESHVSDLGVFCLYNPLYASTQMLDSIKIGLRYLQGKCDRILLTPVDVPLFSAETARKLLVDCQAAVAAPLCNGRKGHPLMLSAEIVPFIEGYDGPGGLAGALGASGCPMNLVETEDEGVLLDIDTPDDYEKLLKYFDSLQF